MTTYKMGSIQELLITEVQNNPCLYNSGDRNYKNTVLKNKVWNDIGCKLGIEGGVALTKWTSIRDRYIRERKNVKPKSGVNPKKKPWGLYPLLWFLDRPDTYYISNNCTNMEAKTLKTVVDTCELPENQNQWISMKVEESSTGSPSTSKHFLRIDCVDNFGTDDSNSLLSPAETFVSDPLLHTKHERKRTLSCATSESGIMSSIDLGRSRNSKEGNFEERLLNVIKSETSGEINEYKNFCMSLIPIFKRLSPRNAANLKIKILQECLNAEFNPDL